MNQSPPLPTATRVSFANPPRRETFNFAHAARVAGAVRLDGVHKTTLCWLWPNRIPLGRVTLLVGDPGLGKSLLTLDIAARVSRGAAWPEEGSGFGVQGSESDPEPRTLNPSSASPPNPQSNSGSPLSTLDSRLPCSVLLLTPEDDLGDTVRPRLEALGADCARIVAIPAIPGQRPPETPGSLPLPGNSKPIDIPRSFEFGRDMARLTHLLDAMPDCRLVIIDPISAYLGGINDHANSEVQQLLLPLAALAQQRGLAVLAVSHLRKKEGAAIHRTMGSLAFVALARAAWAVSRDPLDPQRRLLLPIKNNLAQDLTGLVFTIESQTPGGPPTIHWSPESIAISAETLIGNAGRSRGRPDEERQEAVAWLQKMLADGPRRSRDIKEEAEANGFCYHTLKRAFRKLKGEAVRDGFGPRGRWTWKLPAIEVQNSEGGFWPSMDFPESFAIDSNIHQPKL